MKCKKKNSKKKEEKKKKKENRGKKTDLYISVHDPHKDTFVGFFRHRFERPTPRSIDTSETYQTIRMPEYEISEPYQKTHMVEYETFETY